MTEGDTHGLQALYVMQYIKGMRDKEKETEKKMSDNEWITMWI